MTSNIKTRQDCLDALRLASKSIEELKEYIEQDGTTNDFGDIHWHITKHFLIKLNFLSKKRSSISNNSKGIGSRT